MSNASIILKKKKTGAQSTITNIISCREAFELNSFYELVITMTVQDLVTNNIEMDDIILAPSILGWYESSTIVETDEFDVLSIELNNYIVTIHAYQKTRRLQRLWAKPFGTRFSGYTTLQAAITAYKNSTFQAYGFNITCNFDVTRPTGYYLPTPKDAWTVLVDIANFFGVGLELDNENIAVIRKSTTTDATFGLDMNITSFKWSKKYDWTNNSGYNSVLAYWTDEVMPQGTRIYEEGFARRNNDTLQSTGIPNRAKLVDVSQYYTTEPTASTLIEDARRLLDTLTEEPRDNVSVEIADVWIGYEPDTGGIVAAPEKCKPGQLATIDISPYRFLGRQTISKTVTRVVYDPLNDQVISISLGDDPRKSTAQLLAEMYKRDNNLMISNLVPEITPEIIEES